MAATVNTKGIILKQTDYGESNRMLTVFTSEYGIIKAASHGAKRTKSRQSAASQFLAYADMTFFNNNSDVWNLSSADVLDSFYPIQEDIVKLSLAVYMADLIYASLDLNNPDKELLRLFLNILYAMAYKNIDPKTAKPVFELRCMSIAGFEPVIDRCVVCGCFDELCAFSFDEGGAVCRSCAMEHDVPAHISTLSMMRYVMRAEQKKLFSFSADARTMKQVSYIAERFALMWLDRRFDSLEYYKKMLVLAEE